MANNVRRRRSPKPRINETIGGGFFVFRRGKKTGRVGVRGGLPFEHGSLEQAAAEATRLAKLFPGETFEVFQTSGVVARCAIEAPATEVPATEAEALEEKAAA